MYRWVFNAVIEIPQQLWATCSSVRPSLWEKNFLLYLIRISLLQILSTACLPIPVHLGAESLALSSLHSLIGCLVFFMLNKLCSLLLSFQVMNLQLSCWLSTGLVPVWQYCVSCVGETTYGHNTPDGVSQVLNIRKGSPPWSCWQQFGFFARRVQLIKLVHQLIFLGTAFYCSCGNSITEARLCTCLCRS